MWRFVALFRQHSQKEIFRILKTWKHAKYIYEFNDAENFANVTAIMLSGDVYLLKYGSEFDKSVEIR